MRFYISEYSKDGLRAVTVEHEGEELVWKLATYDKTRLYKRDELFDNINRYIASLPQVQQTAIYDVYSEIHGLFNSEYEYVQVYGLIRDGVRKLYDLVIPNEAAQWLRVYGKFVLPVDLKDDYGKTDTRELTYLRKEYLELAITAEVLRLVLPVWGEFINRYGNIAGNQRKEHFAMALTATSKLGTMPALEKLYEYVFATLSKLRVSMAAVHAGLGSGDQTKEYLAEMVIVRKVCIGETVTAESSIVRNAHNYCKHSSDQLDRKFVGDGRLVAKTPATEKESPDNTSQQESIQVYQRHSAVLYEEAAYAIEQTPYLRAKAGFPDIPEKLVERCIDHVLKIRPKLLMSRKRIAAMTYHKEIVPTLTLTLDNKHQWMCLGIGLAVMLHRGYIGLAGLLTSNMEIPEEEAYGNAGLHTGITKDQYALLDPMYYSDLEGTMTASAKRGNLGFTVITEMVDELTKYQHTFNLPQGIKRLIEAELPDNGSVIDYNFKIGEELVLALHEMH